MHSKSRSCGGRNAARRPVTHDADAPAISVDRLSASYDGRPALVDVSFEISTRERLAIVGPNGAGKSTLLRVLAGLHAADAGTVRIHGHEPRGHICIAFVPQGSEVDWRFPVTVADVVSMGRIGRLGPLRRMHATDREIVRRALDEVDLLDRAERRIDALSGGERQRMFVARALAQESELVLMDEPFAGLDVSSRDELIAVLAGLKPRGVTLLVALHDLGLASSQFERILLLKGRMLGFGPPGAVLTQEALRQAYGSCLRMVEGEAGVLVVHDTACSGGAS
jgi:manganese/iron transport system ATP-binding protein